MDKLSEERVRAIVYSEIMKVVVVLVIVPSIIAIILFTVLIVL